MLTKLAGSVVELAPVRIEDVDALFEIARKPDSIEDYQRAATERGDVLAWLGPAIDGAELAWTIRRADRIVGLISLEPAGPASTATVAEIGYFVDIASSGQGYASDAAHAVVRWAFTKTSIERVTAGISLRNPASVRVVEKVGFVHVKTVANDWEWDGKLWDSAYYELTRG